MDEHINDFPRLLKLAMSLNNEGVYFLLESRPNLAREKLIRSVEIFKHLVSIIPDTYLSKETPDLSVSLRIFDDYKFPRESFGEYCALMSESLLLRPILFHGSQCITLDAAVALYNLAQVYIQGERYNQAIQLLQYAHEVVCKNSCEEAVDPLCSLIVTKMALTLMRHLVSHDADLVQVLEEELEDVERSIAFGRQQCRQVAAAAA